MPSPTPTPTVVYADKDRLRNLAVNAERPDQFLYQPDQPLILEVRDYAWRTEYEVLLTKWNAPVAGSDWGTDRFKLPSKLVVTAGDARDVETFRNAFAQIAKIVGDKTAVEGYSSPKRDVWFPDAQYALACLVMGAMIRRAVEGVTRACELRETGTLGEIVANEYARMENEGNTSGSRVAWVSGNLLLLLQDPAAVGSGGRSPPVSPSSPIPWLAVEDYDRVDERIILALNSLLGPEVAAQPTGAGAGPRVQHTALPEVGFSGLGQWLGEFPRIRPLNTFDSAITTGVGPSTDLLHTIFQQVVKTDEDREKVKYLLSVATGIANYQIEGRPSYFTVLLTAPDKRDKFHSSVKNIFQFAPPVPVQYRNGRFREAIETSPSPNFVLCVTLSDMRAHRCFTYCEKGKDVFFRRHHFTALANHFDGVVIHTHQSGSVEVYSQDELALLGHGIQWFVRPYLPLYQRCMAHFNGDSKCQDLAWRVCGIVANLVEQRASSILLFLQDGMIGKLSSKEGEVTLKPMQSCTLAMGQQLCVKDNFYLDDVCRFLRIDGAHAIAKNGNILGFGLKIKDPVSDEKLGGTGTSATKAIAQKIHEKEEDPESKSFVVQVSGSGYYSLYQLGRRVPTPFDA